MPCKYHLLQMVLFAEVLHNDRHVTYTMLGRVWTLTCLQLISTNCLLFLRLCDEAPTPLISGILLFTHVH